MIETFTIYNAATGQVVMSGESCSPELLMQSGQAILLGVKTDNPQLHYVRDGALKFTGPQPTPSHVFDHASEVWVDSRPVLFLLESARAAINTWRDEQEAAGTVFEHAGRQWDCNPAAKDKLASTAAMPAVPPGFFWTDASEPVNQDVPMDIEAVRALNEAHKVAYFQRGLQIHVRQREMKAALDAMDAAQLAAFEPGWPE